MDLSIFLLLLFSILWTCFTLISKARKSTKLPPGPYKFPIIGNILQLGSKPHQSLAKLSKTYGPIMSLKLGSITSIIVSSPEIIKDVLQTHDLSLSSRTVPSSASAINHDQFSIVWLPVGNKWRKLRKLSKEHMFTVSRLDSGEGLRKEKLGKLSDYLRECSEMGRVVDIGEAAFTTSLNLISATLFSTEFGQYSSDSSQEMKVLFSDVMKCLGTPNLADFFPILKSVDPQGILKQVTFYFDKLFHIFDEIIDEKLKLMNGSDNYEIRDILDALLDLNRKDESELSRLDIIHLVLDLFGAGVDTTSTTIEWAMTELLRNPKILLRVKTEIKEIVGENSQIQESDISKIPYLQAVVKETFRLHPPAPLLVPHKAEADIEIRGYIVPKNAQILVNLWATGRDSNLWSNADVFMPERFLSNYDIKGNNKDFEFIPFGAGRRICPGMPLANRMVPLMLATFVHKFDWKLEDGMKLEEIDVTEKFGLTLQKAIPMKAFPIGL